MIFCTVSCIPVHYSCPWLNTFVSAQQWLDVSAEEIPDLSRGIVIGRKEADVSQGSSLVHLMLSAQMHLQEGLRIVVPCSLAEDLSIGW